MSGSRKKRIQVLGAVGLVGALAGCASVPELPQKSTSQSLPPAEAGALAEFGDTVLKEGGASAFLFIPENEAAMRWRLALIDSAEQSIDLQTFIWSNDECGRLLLDRILKAAERGVRVRLLIDDIGWDWPDEATALVSRLPNVDVRRFNIGRRRNSGLGRGYDLTTDFAKLNRRMHNKQMLIDGRWGIVGGRNIGNPYFGLAEKYNFHDIDLLVAGAIVAEMAGGFDAYWNAEAAYPGGAMVGDLSEKKQEKRWRAFRTMLEKDRQLLLQTSFEVVPKEWNTEFTELADTLVYGEALFLRDEPVVEGDRGKRLIQQLEESVPHVQAVSRVVTPYYIPTDEQIERISSLVHEQGRSVRLLVPAMESINHTHINSHYKRWRKKLLQTGLVLREMKGQPSDALRAMCDTPPVESKFISLHAKGAAFDERWVVMGSLNLDPRALRVNTEHVLLIDCPELAETFAAHYDWLAEPSNAWAVSMNDKGKLSWSSAEKTVSRQPARGFGQRCADWFYRWLPLNTLFRYE